MSKPRSEHSGLTIALVAVIPTLALFAARLVLPNPGPVEVEAAPLDLSVTLTMPKPTEFTPEQAELVRVFDDQATLPFGPCPIVVHSLPAEPVQVIRPKDPEPKAKVPPPRLTLTSIMIAGAEPTAVINGKLCKAGDPVAADWTITQIDGDAGTVVITSKDGDSLTLELRPQLSK